MTVQRILLHAVAVATLGAMCIAQASSSGTESTRQQMGAQQPSTQQGQQQPGQQPSSQQGQPGTQFGQSGTNAPSSMSEPSTTQGSSHPAAGSATAKAGKSPDHLFITKAAQGGLAEVELGNLAQQKAKSEDVKEFGSRMATDHGQANDELKRLAEQKGISVPASLAMKDKQAKKALSAKSGATFDKAYMRDMVKDHEKDVAEFRNEAENGKDPDVKAFAQKTLPTLEQHLAQAKEVASKVGAGNISEKAGTSNMQQKPGSQEKPGSMSKPGATNTRQY